MQLRKQAHGLGQSTRSMPAVHRLEPVLAVSYLSTIISECETMCQGTKMIV